MGLRPAFQDCAVDARNIRLPTPTPLSDSSVRTSLPVKFSILFGRMGFLRYPGSGVDGLNGSRIHAETGFTGK